MLQTALIQSIIKDIKIGPRASLKPMLAPSTKILQHTLRSKDFDNKLYYRSVIGKLNYLAGLTQPDIQYAVHACARFSANPKQKHGEAIEHIVCYLKGTEKIGIILNPNNFFWEIV